MIGGWFARSLDAPVRPRFKMKAPAKIVLTGRGTVELFGEDEAARDVEPGASDLAGPVRRDPPRAVEDLVPLHDLFHVEVPVDGGLFADVGGHRALDEGADLLAEGDVLGAEREIHTLARLVDRRR